MKMASSQVGRMYLPVPKMSLSDAKCPICFCILIEPVTMPCKHELCRPCFEHTMKETSLTCPMCRTRFASWARKAARHDQLINQKRWTQIQKDFPERVRKRLLGLDDSLSEEMIARSLSAPGEIRKEYEDQMKQIAEEKKRDEELNTESFINLLNIWKEEAASVSQKSEKQETKSNNAFTNRNLPTFVEKVKVEKGKKSKKFPQPVTLPPRTENCVKSLPKQGPSENVAEQIKSVAPSKVDCGTSASAEQDESTPGPSSGSERKRSGSAQSNDSITEELRHFTPIKVAPKTPPKKLPDGRIIDPPLVQTKPLNLVRTVPSSFNHPTPRSSLAQKLMTVCSDRQDHRNAQSKTLDESTETDASLLQASSNPLLPLEPNLPLTEQTSSYKAQSSTLVAQKALQQECEPSSKSEVSVAASVAFQDCSRRNSENSYTGSDEPRSKKRKARSTGGRLAADKQGEREMKISAVLCSTKTAFPGLKSDDFVKQQILVMEHLKQEEQDRQLALELQKKFDVESEMYQRGKLGYREPYILRKKRLPPVPVVSSRRRSQC